MLSNLQLAAKLAQAIGAIEEVSGMKCSWVHSSDPNESESSISIEIRLNDLEEKSNVRLAKISISVETL